MRNGRFWLLRNPSYTVADVLPKHEGSPDTQRSRRKRDRSLYIVTHSCLYFSPKGRWRWRNHCESYDGLLGSWQEVRPEGTVRDPESEERQPDRSERYVNKTCQWGNQCLYTTVDNLPLMLNLLFNLDALWLFSVTEEVKRLCATQFNNIFFLDWWDRRTDGLTTLKTVSVAGYRDIISVMQ